MAAPLGERAVDRPPMLRLALIQCLRWADRKTRPATLPCFRSTPGPALALRPTFGCVPISGDVNCWEARFTSQTIPQEDGQADVTSPQGKTPAPEFFAGFTALAYRGHCKGTSPLYPDWIFRPAMQLQERVAVAAGAVAKIGALGEWTGSPREIASLNEQRFDIG
jgi:hypothetical protein